MKRITYQDRKVLEKLLKTSMSIRKMARELGFSHSVILYEIQHHSGEHTAYEADTAQTIYERKQLNKGNIKKINNNPDLKNFILTQLDNDLSPEQIAGRLKHVNEDYEKAGNKRVCHETIYAFIYEEENAPERYWQKLMRHRPKRIKAHSRRYRKGGSIKNMVSISQRSSHIDERQEIGHWESDSMIFSKQKEILSVQVERKTRYVTLTKCKDKTALETYKAITSQLSDKDASLLKTLTFDRGTEASMHQEMAKYLGVKIYFCHPYSSWEKGSVENRNMFIRRYLPRYTSMKNMSHDDIYAIQEKLNNRPMKCLNYRSPNEMMFYEKFSRFPPQNTILKVV